MPPRRDRSPHRGARQGRRAEQAGQRPDRSAAAEPAGQAGDQAEQVGSPADLAVVQKDPARREHPSELLLLIEIADSSLRIDRGIKRTICAEAGVPAYWIVDVNTATVEIHTSPANGKHTALILPARSSAG